MIIRPQAEVSPEEVREEGVRDVKRQVLLGEHEGAPNFILRRFTVAPGGFTFYHSHSFEHEIYILKGKGIARSDKGEIAFRAHTAILVKPNEVHQFVNSGTTDLIFLCIIPRV